MYCNLFGDNPVPFATAPAASGPRSCIDFFIDLIYGFSSMERPAFHLADFRRSELIVLSSLEFDNSESWSQNDSRVLAVVGTTCVDFTPKQK